MSKTALWIGPRLQQKTVPVNCYHLLEPWVHFCANQVIAVKLCQPWPNHRGIIKCHKKFQWIPASLFTVLPVSKVPYAESQRQVRSSSSKYFGSSRGADVEQWGLGRWNTTLANLQNKNVLAFDFQHSLEHFCSSLLKFGTWECYTFFLTELENRNMLVPEPKSGAKQTVTLGRLKYKSWCLENPDLNTAFVAPECCGRKEKKYHCCFHSCWKLMEKAVEKILKKPQTMHLLRYFLNL